MLASRYKYVNFGAKILTAKMTNIGLTDYSKVDELGSWYKSVNFGAVVDSGWEGCRESRRCSRDTYPESYITKYTSIRRKNLTAKMTNIRLTDYSKVDMLASWYKSVNFGPVIDSGLVGSASRDHTLAGPLWEGYRESRRCSRDTYTESYITKYTSICTERYSS